jgi:hypothetical protein
MGYMRLQRPILEKPHNVLSEWPFDFKDSNTEPQNTVSKANSKHIYYVVGHYPFSCIYLNTVLFIFQDITFRRLDSVSVFR